MSLSGIVGILITAQRSLLREGRNQDATHLGSTVAHLLDHALEHPEVASLPGENPDPTVASVYELAQHPAVSLAVRTAGSGNRPTKAQWRQIRREINMHPPRMKRWLCCSKPEKRKTRKGTVVWGAVCKYRTSSGKAKGTLMGSWVTLSRNGNVKPREVSINGKRMKFCTGAMK